MKEKSYIDKRQEYLIFPYLYKNKLYYAYFSFVWDYGNGDKDVVYIDHIGSSVTLETLLNRYQNENNNKI